MFNMEKRYRNKIIIIIIIIFTYASVEAIDKYSHSVSGAVP